EGVWFLPELNAINWVQRRAYICFDSDYLSKPNVCLAINSLCDELQERGADVHVLTLPEGAEGAKVGLDDYLLDHAPDELRDRISEAEPLGLSRALWRINTEVVYVEDPGLILVEESLQK